MSEEKRRFIIIWCETGVHTWAVNSVDGFLDYLHEVWAAGKMLRHNLPSKERRKFDRGLARAMIVNTRQNVIQNLLEDGYLNAECRDCRRKRSLEAARLRGQDVVFVGEFMFDRNLYEENKDEIEKNVQLWNLGVEVQHG